MPESNELIAVAKCIEQEHVLWAMLPDDACIRLAADELRGAFTERCMALAIAPFGQSWRQQRLLQAWTHYVDELTDLVEEPTDAQG